MKLVRKMNSRSLPRVTLMKVSLTINSKNDIRYEISNR